MTSENDAEVRAAIAAWPVTQAGAPCNVASPVGDPSTGSGSSELSSEGPTQTRFLNLKVNYESERALTGAVSGDTTTGTAAQRRRKNRKNNKSRKRKDKRAAIKTNLPEIGAELRPVIPNSIWDNFRDGKYYPTPHELEAHHSFFQRVPTMPSFAQKAWTDDTDTTSVHLFHGTSVLTPRNAMIDTGSEVSLMITTKMAEQLKLTWNPGSASVVGVGGSGGAEGFANETIVLRLGQYYAGCPLRELSPLKGCFEIRVCPVIMSPSVLQNIRYQAIIGQGIIRACGGYIDPINERFVYFPAWMSHGCSKLKCSVPIVMSKPNTGEHPTLEEQVVMPRAPRVTAFKYIGTNEHECRSLTTMMVRVPDLDSNATTSSSSSEAPSLIEVSSEQEEPQKTVTATKHAKAKFDKRKPKQKKFKIPGAPSNKPRDTSEVKVYEYVKAALDKIPNVTVAPIATHPGFPQREAPDREGYREWTRNQAARNQLDTQLAKQLKVEKQVIDDESGAQLLRPAVIGFLAADLLKLDFVTASYEIDCSRSGKHTEAQDQRIAARVFNMVRPLLTGLTQPTQGAPQAPAQTYTQAVRAPPAEPFPAPSNPTQSPAPAPAANSGPPASDSAQPELSAEVRAEGSLPVPNRRMTRSQKVLVAKPNWPTCQQAAEVAKLPKRQRQAAAQALTALSVASSVSSATAQSVGAESALTNPAYGHDLAAFALIIGCLAVTYCIYRLLSWYCRTHWQHRLVTLFAALSLAVQCWANTTVQYSMPALWARVRDEPCTPFYIVVVMIIIPASCRLWSRAANWHFRQVVYE
jgi:hypothetical protein